MLYILNSESHILEILDKSISSLRTDIADRAIVATVAKSNFISAYAELR